MNIIGYIIYGISVFITLGWCLQIRTKAKNEQATEKSMELQGFLMTVSLVLIPLLHLSNFHLLWMIPASFILGLLSITTPIKILWFFSSIYFSFWYIGIRNLGREYYLQGEFDKAIEAYKEDIIKNPKSSETHFNLGLAYGKNGQQEKEIECYIEAIKLKPNIPEMHFNLGNVYNEVGNKYKAIEFLNNAIRLRSNYIKAHYVICKIYSEIGDSENTKKEYELIKSLDSNVAKELTEFINI